MKKRIISLLMCLVMAFSIVPAAAWAEVLPSPQDTPDSGAGTAGVYTTGEDTVVARIGDTGYASLPAALEAAGDGSTVTLLQDVTLPDNDKVYISKEYGQQVSFAIGYTTPGSPDSRPAVKDTTSPATGDAGLVVYAAIARAAAPARHCCCAASASTNNAEDDRPLAGHLLLPTAGKSGIIGIYETRRKEHGL